MKEVTWMKEGLLNAGTPEATESEHGKAKGTAALPQMSGRFGLNSSKSEPKRAVLRKSLRS